MLLKTLQLTVRNLRGVGRVLSTETFLNVQSQSYGKFVSRKPAAIVNEDELFDIEENITPIENLKSTRSRSRKSKSNAIQKENVDSQAELEFQETEHVKNNVSKINTKLYENEKFVSSMMLTLKSKKKRKKDEKILLEGIRFIEDAMEAGLEPEYIIFSRWEDIKHINFSKKETKLYKVPYRSIQLWSSLTTSPGIMGIFKRPNIPKPSKSSLPITIICDNVRDPGNMGSILRAAAGVGCEKVILTKGCVDFWDPKVLRSATGAHFRVPVFASQEWNDIRDSLTNDADIYVADNKIDSYNEERNETEMSEENSKEKEEPVVDSKPEKYNKKHQRSSLLRTSNLPVIPYYAVDYTKNEVILIIGGETEGLSNESFNLIEERQGIRVNIPLDNNIDSLNAGMALGIVAFEIKRQFLQVQLKLNKLTS